MTTAGSGSGLDSQLGLEEELTYGTSITPTRFLEFLSESIDDAPMSLDSPPSLGRGMFPRHDRTFTYAGTAAGDTVFNFQTKGFGKLLRLIFGDLVFTWPGSTNASCVLTATANPATGGTVTVGTTIYTFRTTLTASTTAYEVKIETAFADTLRNLVYAINHGRGDGTYYGSLTPQHPTVVATTNGVNTVTVTDRSASGTTSNTYPTTNTATNMSWATVTMLGGLAGTDTARLQTYTIADRGTYGRSATLQINRPSRDGIDRPFTYTGAKVRSWTLSVALDGWVTLSVTWDAKAGVTSTALATASYISGSSYYNFTQMGVTVGAVTVPISSFELTGTWGLQTETRNLNNTKREPLANDFWTITGTMGAEFTSLAPYTAFLAGTQAQLIATLSTGATVIPSSASPYSLVITIPAMKYTGSTPMVSGPDVIQTALPWSAYYNGSNPIITCAYQSDDLAP